MKICTLIITRDRENELIECLKALKKQTYSDFDTLIVNVGQKQDLIKKYLEKEKNKKIKYISEEINDKNKAYRFALEKVCEKKYDYVWCLHDDVKPNVTALEELVKATEHNVSFVTSSAFTSDGKAINTPNISGFSDNKGYGAWYQLLRDSMVRIGGASFVSTLIKVDAIKKCGLPNEEDRFGDNSNYLSRLIANYAAAYLVGKSEVVHNHKSAVIVKKEEKKLKICAIVVTYNRKAMLIDCINALLKQTYNNYDILIVDNASTDGTYDEVKDMLSDRVKYVNTGANLGGSGGFYYGMKHAYELGYDWIWIMDDDVVPTPKALAELVNATTIVKSASFFASAVYSKNEQAMNSPEISRYSTNGYRFWYERLADGMVRLAHATFVSLLINCKAIEKCGLPLRDYFIWGDDTEYTMRIIGKYGAAYIVGKSKVYHMRENSSSLGIRKENNPNRIKMYYYMVRNTLLNTYTYSGEKACERVIKDYLRDCKAIKANNEPYKKIKIDTIKKAIKDFKKKNYNYDAFVNRYQVYGQEKAIVSTIGAKEIVSAFEGRYPYTINNKLNGVSVFTAFEPVPAFIKDYKIENVDVTISDEIKRNFFNRLKATKVQGEYCFVDFADSLNRVAEFTKDGNTIKVNYTPEFEEAYNNGKIELLKGYKMTIKNPEEVTDKEVVYAAQKMVLALSKTFMAHKFVLVKRTGNKHQDLLEKLYAQFKLRVPKCQEVEIVDGEDNEALAQKIENLL